MFDVFIFADIEMPFTGKKAFCVLEYARSESNKAVQHAFVSEFSKQSPDLDRRFGHGTKNSRRKVVCAGKKNLDDQKHQKRWSSVFVKKSCKAQRNRYEEQVWKPRFHQEQFGSS